MEMNSSFQEAREEFLRSLSPNEKSKFAACSSSEELFRDIEIVYVKLVTANQKRANY